MQQSTCYFYTSLFPIAEWCPWSWCISAGRLVYWLYKDLSVKEGNWQLSVKGTVECHFIQTSLWTEKMCLAGDRSNNSIKQKNVVELQKEQTCNLLPGPYLLQCMMSSRVWWKFLATGSLAALHVHELGTSIRRRPVSSVPKAAFCSDLFLFSPAGGPLSADKGSSNLTW